MNSEILSIKCNHLFKEKNLVFDQNFLFHKRNLLIGRNGSGKTRFLKSLENYYKENKPKNEMVLTLYFPEIHSSNINISSCLYDAIFEKESLEFEDFLQLALKDSVALIDDIFRAMSIQATRTQKRLQDDFKRLNRYFNDFFNGELCDKISGDSIFMIKHTENEPDRKIPIQQAIEEFSPGELILFYVSIFIFYLDHLTDKNLILIIDEPELHLHPKALISLMEMLMNSTAVSQLWVASHSLFIMPLFPFEQIVHFNQSHICPLNRHTYKNVYDDLIGLENVDIYELLKSVENWSYYQFVVENFFLPNAKPSTKKEDEQVQKIINYLSNIQNNKPLKVLDYGAGKFRLWDCLKQNIPLTEERDKLLTYNGFEPYPGDVIPGDIVFLKNENDLEQDYYDVVVLMNVLHEIDPKEWIKTFNIIEHSLNENGVLIFLEVLSLTNGEQPYGKSGFLLLQDPQVKILFQNALCTKYEVDINEKTNCWIISKRDLSNITFEKVIAAIRSLEEITEHELKELDNKRISIAHNPKNIDKIMLNMTARKYAFLSQQYINAHFAYSRLSRKILIKKTEQKKPFPGQKK